MPAYWNVTHVLRCFDCPLPPRLPTNLPTYLWLAGKCGPGGLLLEELVFLYQPRAYPAETYQMETFANDGRSGSGLIFAFILHNVRSLWKGLAYIQWTVMLNTNLIRKSTRVTYSSIAFIWMVTLKGFYRFKSYNYHVQPNKQHRMKVLLGSIHLNWHI